MQTSVKSRSDLDLLTRGRHHDVLPLRRSRMSKRILLGALAGHRHRRRRRRRRSAWCLGRLRCRSRARCCWAASASVVGLIAGGVAGDPKKVFGSSNDRELKRLRPLVEQVSRFEAEIAAR